MRIHVVSDLHFEFHRDRGAGVSEEINSCEADVLVLAGDCFNLKYADVFEEMAGRFAHRDVVYLPGNHEFYGTSPKAAEAVLSAVGPRLGPRFRILNPGVCEIRGRRFVGAPLWFPRETGDAHWYRRNLNDFSAIRGFVPWVYDTHDAHLRFLERNVGAGDVVVTHHLPHPGLIAPKFIGHPLNDFFCDRECAPLAERGLASLWIHGHSHEPCDKTLWGTRFVRNPLGYPAEGVGFNPSLIVEV